MITLFQIIVSSKKIMTDTKTPLKLDTKHPSRKNVNYKAKSTKGVFPETYDRTFYFIIKNPKKKQFFFFFKYGKVFERESTCQAL
jgi:hypothetical protein